MKTKREFISAQITTKAEKALKNGHPWVYGEEIKSMSGDAPKGSLVDVFCGNSWQGTGFYNPDSKISVRIISRNSNDTFNYDFWKRRIKYAIAYRRTVIDDENFDACRIIHGEADMIPGLTVDRYNDILSVQITCFGVELIKNDIYKALKESFEEDGVTINGIFERNDVSLRTKEGLELYKGWYNSDGQGHPDSATVQIKENGIIYNVDVENGQKTGFFLDQKYNRLAASKIAKGKRVLDCFTHTGSFGLNCAAGGASHVTSVDISEDALKMARENCRLNGFDGNIDYVCADVFEYLSDLCDKKSHEFDYIILDPPAFTKSRDTVRDAYRGYKDICMRAMKILPRGGYLAVCSCSHFMAEDLFEKAIRTAAFDAHKQLRQIEKRTQGPDHPILWNVPETYYLKFYIFQLI